MSVVDRYYDTEAFAVELGSKNGLHRIEVLPLPQRNLISRVYG